MAQYTNKDILLRIERNSGPIDINLSGLDLSELDFSTEFLSQSRSLKEKPIWVSNETGGIDLRGAYLWCTNLHRANFHGADFKGADLREADLSSAILTCANLVDSKLESTILTKADLTYSNLTGLNLTVVKNIENAYWYQAVLERTRLNKTQLGNCIGEELDGEHEKAREAYLILKNNFKMIGRDEDAGWAYIKERKMERLTHKPSLASRYFAQELENLPSRNTSRYFKKIGFYAHHTSIYLRDSIFELTCDYGESISKFLITIFVLLCAFSVAFWVVRGVGSDINVSNNFFDYLLFTLATFSTIDIPRLDVLNSIAKILKAIAATTGIGIFAILMFMLGNRINRT